MCLLEVLVYHAALDLGTGTGLMEIAFPARQLAEILGNHIDESRVLDAAGAGYDKIGRSVNGAEIVGNAVVIEGRERFRSTKDGAAERMIGPEARYKDLVDEIVGGVLDHVDFFEDDIALAVELVVREQGSGNQIAEQVKGSRQVLVEHFDIVACDLAAGECVDIAADRVALDRDFARGPIASAFE